MESFCRGCLVLYNDPTEFQQYSEKNKRLFHYCTNIQVKTNDHFKLQLCRGCYTNMKMACQFKKQCRTSEKKVKNYMALKSAGDDIDICTFLKNNDTIYKLPLMKAISTPPTSKTKFKKANDDDIESNCTSIQNFIRDMLPEDDIAEVEEQLINEVIAEEIDLSDDSLNSQWLDDNVSIDTDLKFDFSFSPFQTPKSDKIEPYCPPKQHVYVTDEKNSLFRKQLIEKGAEKDPKDSATVSSCRIEKNIAVALKDKNVDNFALEDLLRTPKCNSQASMSPTTKIITNILFGNDLGPTNSPKEAEVLSNKYADDGFDTINTQVDIIEEFFMKSEPVIFNEESAHTTEYTGTKSGLIKETLQSDRFVRAGEVMYIAEKSALLEDMCDLNDLYCKLCLKEFPHKTRLKIHLNKKHRVKVVGEGRRYSAMCDFCGKSFHDRGNYSRHRRICTKTQENLSCSKCGLTFTTSSRLKTHMASTHDGEQLNGQRKEFACAICPAMFSQRSNLSAHERRHKKAPELFCDVCGRGYYRKTDLVLHIRSHTKEKPLACPAKGCSVHFARPDALKKHLACRHATRTKTFECEKCLKKFYGKESLAKHIARNACYLLRETPSCGHCGKQFKSDSYRRKHESQLLCNRLPQIVIVKRRNGNRQRKRKQNDTSL